MHIDEIIDLVNRPEKNFCIPKQWTQGRTVFGGLSACIAYQAALNALKNTRPVRTMNCNFVAPFNAEKDFSIEVELLREGGNVSSVQSSIVQNKQVCVRAQFVFGTARESKILHNNTITHSMPVPKKASFLPNIPGLTPRFLKQFDLHFTHGGKPFTGSKHSHIHGWMRLKKQSKHLTHAHLIALIDAWPPTLFQKLKKPV